MTLNKFFTPDNATILQLLPNTPVPPNHFPFTCPNDMIVQPLTLFCLMTCDATVANRYITIQITSAGGTSYTFIDPIPLVASESRYISIAPNLPYQHIAASTSSISLPIPREIFLTPADDIDIYDAALIAGDVFGFLCAQFRAWIT